MDFPKKRERTMPLVPRPFARVVRMRQRVFVPSLNSEMKTFIKFCPKLNIAEYQKTFSKAKKELLDVRASTLMKRSITNQLYKASEFCWEVSAWQDVFGLMYNDETFRIDKRPYDFLEVDHLGNESVKRRIPDATIGLRSYDNFFLKRGYTCDVKDCTQDHSRIQPDKRLSEKRLLDMMYNPECGLVIDGVWGKTELLFPFAVYEAKKRAMSYEQAENQIYHACQTYLAMLDDLARNPSDVSEYQTDTSSRYQIFAFTSCGSYWQVFAAYNLLDDCLVETLWEGDVKEFSRAFDLICIVDQIHDYAVNHHRPFVMRHLEAWHKKHRRSVAKKKHMVWKALNADGDPDRLFPNLGVDGFDSADNSGYSDDEDIETAYPGNFPGYAALFDIFNLGPPPQPAEWFRLKELTNKTRGQMASETRKRNRAVRLLARKRVRRTRQKYTVTSRQAGNTTRKRGDVHGGSARPLRRSARLQKRQATN